MYTNGEPSPRAGFAITDGRGILLRLMRGCAARNSALSNCLLPCRPLFDPSGFVSSNRQDPTQLALSRRLGYPRNRSAFISCLPFIRRDMRADHLELFRRDSTDIRHGWTRPAVPFRPGFRFNEHACR